MRSINLPVKIVNGVVSYLLVRDLTIVPLYLQGSISTQDLAHYRHNKVIPFCLSPTHLDKSFNVSGEEVKEWEKPTIYPSGHHFLSPEIKRRRRSQIFARV